MKLPTPAPPASWPLQTRHLRDLRGATRLATEATLAVTALTEALHARIASVPGLRGPAQTRGITRLIYKTVGGITAHVGGGLDRALAVLAHLLAQDAPANSPESSPPRDAILAALNGVLGDHLAATHNPLAITMALQLQGRTLPPQPAALHAALQQAQLVSPGRLLILLHGLCMNPQQWCREGHDHGAALAQAGAYTPLYLHYNTGLSLQANGLAFAQHMQALLLHWPQPLQRVVLLGHSMGGLVARSALHQGQLAGHTWVNQVDDAVFLGSPHQGAPLERAGTWVDLILGSAPYAAPLARLTRLRSAGIQSLGHADLLGRGGTGPPDAMALPARPRCYAVAGISGAVHQDIRNRLWGDGLVPLDSALGRHADARRQLGFEETHQLTVAHTHHMALLNSPPVTEALLRWLT